MAGRRPSQSDRNALWRFPGESSRSGPAGVLEPRLCSWRSDLTELSPGTRVLRLPPVQTRYCRLLSFFFCPPGDGIESPYSLVPNVYTVQREASHAGFVRVLSEVRRIRAASAWNSGFLVPVRALR